MSRRKNRLIVFTEELEGEDYFGYPVTVIAMGYYPEIAEFDTNGIMERPSDPNTLCVATTDAVYVYGPEGVTLK
jgi:hypothetical protein